MHFQGTLFAGLKHRQVVLSSSGVELSCGKVRLLFLGAVSTGLAESVQTYSFGRLGFSKLGTRWIGAAPTMVVDEGNRNR
jgi:hypothetical protein